MGRPTSKPALLEAAAKQMEALWKLIDSMPDEEQNATFMLGETEKRKQAHWKRDKNLRDVLTHLYEWHQLLLRWVRDNESGEAKPFIPAPYSFKSYGQMNVELWEKHQFTSLTEAKAMLRESHTQVMGLIEGFSEEELFEKKRFTWTGTSTLGSYCVSAAPSHYDWAIKKIKANHRAYLAAQAE